MRVTLNIWSLLCPLSPLLSSFSLCLSISPQLAQSKGSVKLCLNKDLRDQQKKTKQKKTIKDIVKVAPFHFDNVLSTDNKKGSKQPISVRYNNNPAGTNAGVDIQAK